MPTPQYVDISAFQPTDIDWQAYKKWSSQWDGISRIAMRSSYGFGYTDVHFQLYRQAALNAGIDMIIYYHYAYPQINGAIVEADSQHRIVGTIRPQDVLMLDLEENVPQATSEWAYEWLSRQEANYSGKLPTIYASDAYIRQRLQDGRLARFPLTLANWQFTPDERPACPPPWKHYTYLQYSDRASIPGIPGLVDANIYLGGNMTTIPTGWKDDGKTLTGPNGVTVRTGFRDHVLSHNWDANNWPLQTEEASNPLELSNTSLGGGTWQPFRWTVLEWDSKRGVQEMWTGQELLAMRKMFDVAKDKVSTLTQQLATAKEQIATLQQQLDANAQAQHIKELEDGLVQIGKLAGQLL